jgi:hypothetical protein
MTIIELGRTQPISARTSPIREFIRQIKLGPYEPDAGILTVSSDLDESDRALVNVTGVRDLQGAAYTPKTSLADTDNEQQSFYWDSVNQILYIHILPSDNPFTTTYLYGLAEGYSDGKIVYIDTMPYLPLLDSTPGIEQEQDIENYDQLALITGGIDLNNEDGRLDNLKDFAVYGNDVLIYYLPDMQDTYTDSDLVQLASLYVEDYDISLQSVSLRVQDRRKSQDTGIPRDRFTADDYPSMMDNNLGKVIPVLWGTANEIPCVITNEDVTTGDVTYRAAITLTALGTVAVEVESGVWSTATITPTSTTLATGELALSATDARNGTRPLKAKLIAPTGIAITRVTDIIKDATERFTGASYTSGNYNTTEWELEELAIESGAYYIDKESSMFDLIKDVQNGANVGFRYEITPDGRRTIRFDDETRAITKDIPNIVISNRDSLSIETDSATLAAEVVVNYGNSYVDNDVYNRLVDSSRVADVLEEYQQRPRKTYDTILTNATDAQERATYVLDRFDTIRGIGEFELIGVEYLTLRIYDIITIEITPDEFEQVRRPFYGKWKCKVISIAPDPRTVTNVITAVLIEEA